MKNSGGFFPQDKYIAVESMVNESNEPQKDILPWLRGDIRTTLEHGKITVMYSVIQVWG